MQNEYDGNLTHRVRLLIVEDNKPLTNALESYFSSQNYLVDIAFNGEQAREKYESNEYDVILLDIFMPVKDGLETLTDIRANNNTTKVITMTGMYLDDKDYLDTSVKLGANAVIQKPFAPKDLLALIVGVLGQA